MYCIFFHYSRTRQDLWSSFGSFSVRLVWHKDSFFILPKRDYERNLHFCIIMSGYDPKFTGVDIPLPTFNSTLDAQILKKTSFGDDAWRKYIHYSVATNKARRSPACVSLNINQKLLKPGQERDLKWMEDKEIGDEFQLNNDYYAKNDWDKGHMARFATSAWGETEEEAGKAGDATMYYSNACLQHKNLNRDEWLNVEDWVKDLEEDKNDMISTFSGPIYGPVKRFLEPAGREPAEIPVAFFKVVAFIHKDGHLTSRAFIFLQDAEAVKGLGGRRLKSHQSYQVTTTEVEYHTGLVFPEILKASNPIGMDFPPAPIGGGGDILNFPTKSPTEDYSQVFIAAALINPKGKDSDGEWVSIANYSGKSLKLDGWKLSDGTGAPLDLSGVIPSGETLRVNPRKRERDGGAIVLSNKKGLMKLIDPSDNNVDLVSWTGSVEGVPTVFDPC